MLHSQKENLSHFRFEVSPGRVQAIQKVSKYCAQWDWFSEAFRECPNHAETVKVIEAHGAHRHETCASWVMRGTENAVDIVDSDENSHC